MSQFNTVWKRAPWALFLILSSACSTCCDQWAIEQSCGALPGNCSNRIFLGCGGEQGLELEFVRTAYELRLYLNVFGLQIPVDDYNECTSKVFVSFRDRSYCFQAKRFQGGQRLLIPEPVMQDIIHSLEDCQPVFIQVDRYKADIYPDNFLPVYNRLRTCCLK